jgi:hypothetical protein
VVATLSRDAEVTPLERRGKWTLIRYRGEDGGSKQEGWVYSSLLTDATAP